MARFIILTKIDEALGKYYELKEVNTYFNENGDGLFKLYCIDNGMEEDQAIRDDLEEAADDNILVDFDKDNFPGIESAEDKNAAIYAILKKCEEEGPNPNFDAKDYEFSIEFKKGMLEITPSNKDKITKEYKSLFTKEFIDPMIKDE